LAFCLVATWVLTYEIEALAARSLTKPAMSDSAKVTMPVLPATEATGPLLIAAIADDNVAICAATEAAEAAVAFLAVVHCASRSCIAGKMAAEQVINHCDDDCVLLA